MPWIQNYYALGDSIFLTALCAALPIFFLFWALGIKKMRGHLAVFITWLITVLVALIVYRMPVGALFSAAVYGATQGIFIICWLTFNAVFFYNLIVKSGNFEIIKSSIASISNDRRIQAILIGFCFSAFLEGTTGMGAPVAISAAMLIGLGFPAFTAVIVCLVGNTIPAPFGSIGIPSMTTVNTAFGDMEGALLAVSGSVGGVMCIYALIIPFFMLVVMCGWKAAKEMLPLCLVAGVAYSIPNFFITRFLGPELPSLLSPLVSLAAIIFFIRFWKPPAIWRFPEDTLPIVAGKSCPAMKKFSSPGRIVYAWTPFILVTLIMVIWSLPVFKKYSALLPTNISIEAWPGLQGLIYRAAPIVSEPAVYPAIFNFDVFAAAGTALLFVSRLVGFVFKIKVSVFIEVMITTLKQLKFTLLTIILVLSIAHLSNYSGISFSLGLAFAATGSFFMVFSPFIGFAGVFLTGSVSSSGAIFGNLQRVSAEQLGLNPVITVTASMMGAVMGKMISLQSITIGAAASGLAGKEGFILNKMLKYAFLLLVFGIVIILIMTYIFPGYFSQIAALDTK